MWRDKQRHPSPGGAADQNSAHYCEGFAPASGRHADMREPKRRVVAGDTGRHGIEEPDYRADERRANRREDDLSDRQGRASGENANNKRADDARAAIEPKNRS